MTRAELIDAIRQAFAEVTLEDGIGLHEAQAIDDYEDHWVQKNHRKNDEKQDWNKIPVSQLIACRSSLSFFDAKGMRFHLPAFLIAELEQPLDSGVVFQLTQSDAFSLDRFLLLSSEQTHAVVEFLWAILKDPDYTYDHPQVENALENYWLSRIEPPH